MHSNAEKFWQCEQENTEAMVQQCKKRSALPTWLSPCATGAVVGTLLRGTFQQKDRGEPSLVIFYLSCQESLQP